MDPPTSWDSLRKQARKLEAQLDEQMHLYRKLVSTKTDDGTDKDLELGIDQLLQHLQQVNSHMQAWVSSGGSEIFFHTLTRHQEILQDLTQEFNRLRSSLRAKKEHASLLEDFREFDRTRLDLEESGGSCDQALLKEHASVNRSTGQEGEYATYRHTYLMPPLTGVRTPTRRSAGMPSSSRARAADLPSTSRAGTSRGGARLVPPIPPTYHHAGWPDLPTELIGWRYGTSYPIPIEPPMPDHRYVSDPDSPSPPREYMDEMLGLVASLEGMVLRREVQLSIIGFPMPPLHAGPQAGPSRPSGGAGPSRPFRRARRGESSRRWGGRRARHRGGV